MTISVSAHLKLCRCIYYGAYQDWLIFIFFVEPQLWSTSTPPSSDFPLTHWGRDKMAAISHAFSWMKMFEFQLKFHWSLFLRFQLTIFQHWLRLWLGADQATSHYLNQLWLDYRRIYICVSRPEWVKWVCASNWYFVHDNKELKKILPKADDYSLASWFHMMHYIVRQYEAGCYINCFWWEPLINPNLTPAHSDLSLSGGCATNCCFLHDNMEYGKKKKICRMLMITHSHPDFTWCITLYVSMKLGVI